MSEHTPLERAIFAVVKHILGDDIPADEHTCCVAVAKRELEKAVPAATASTHGRIDYVRGWNDRGKQMGLE